MSYGKNDQMLGNNYRFVKLWLLSIVIYFLLFAFVSDLYFKSPIHHGLKLHKGPPIANRVVLIVADGLRHESLVRHKLYTPYLSELLNGNSAQGMVHTKVPTESRPGHAALLGGIYEDPSAVFSGWKANIVDFDTVVNQSNYVWAFGSPDIVQAYKKKDSKKLLAESYSPLFQDFSGNGNTSGLDNWVFDKVNLLLHNKYGSCEESFFKLRRYQRKLDFSGFKIDDGEACEGLDEFVGKPFCYLQYKNGEPSNEFVALNKRIIDLKKSCSANVVKNCDGTLCESGNLFFLHLLGMDSAGHIHKPNDEQFLETLNNLDKGVKEMVMLINDFFNDEETAYIFTADHGMTDWGSHGDGSNMETEVPFIMWGKGIKTSREEYHLYQADIAPMISILLGVPVPTNSYGFIEHRILNASQKIVKSALLTNLAQLIELYSFLRKNYKNDYFFKDMKYFEQRTPADIIRFLEEESNVNVDLIKETALEVLNGIKYLNDYYFTPKMATVWYGFILWTIYLAVSLHESNKSINTRWSRKFDKGRARFQAAFLTLVLCVTGYSFYVGTSYFSHLYIVFASVVTLSVFGNKRIAFDIYTFNEKYKMKIVIIRILVLTSLVQLLVFGFFYKYIYGLVMFILVVWVSTFEHLQKSLKCLWLFANFCLTGCLLLPHSTSFHFDKFYIGVVLWVIYYAATLYIFKENLWKEMKLPIILCFITIINVHTIAKQFEDDGVLNGPRIISWIVTGVSLFSIPFCPNNIMIRFNYICATLAVPFILMSFNYDIIFYTILVLWLNLWIIIETKFYRNQSNIFHKKYTTSLQHNDSPVDFDSYRSSFFYIAITICYFFAIGNMASFSGFDPLWSRAFVSTFRPILMASLIMFKMFTPFFLITCAYLAINTIQQRNVMNIFTIVMLQLNQMVLNFMLNVKNEGSWKEIGQSLSHFVVMEVMAIVLLTFYMLSKYVTGFCMPTTLFLKTNKEHL